MADWCFSGRGALHRMTSLLSEPLGSAPEEVRRKGHTRWSTSTTSNTAPWCARHGRTRKPCEGGPEKFE